MTDELTLPTDAVDAVGAAVEGQTTPDPVADGAITADGRVAGIDLRQVARLAMYPREALYLVDLADGPQRQVEPDDWDTLVHKVVSHPDSRLSPVTAGRYDIIWRVDWATREEN